VSAEAPGVLGAGARAAADPAAAIEARLLPDTATPDPATGALTVGGCDLLALAERFGTPLFVYDEAHLRDRCREAVGAFGPGNVVYATKAFLCGAMARLAHAEGLLLDVATGGELEIALRAGVPADRLVVHGNNKSLEELRRARNAGVAHIVVDSFDELDRHEALHREDGRRPRVQLRVTPGVHVHTHQFVATGQDDSKFGFNIGNGDALRAVDWAWRSPSVELVGVHAHIGSQVLVADNFARAAEIVGRFAAPLDVAELTLGGGLGVAYVAGEVAPTIREWADLLVPAVRAAGVTARLRVEPGRSIVATAAMTLYTVGTIKAIPGIRTYVAVDGGMSDNPRPVLYGSGYEAFLPRAPRARRPRVVRLVGKHCESGDVLIDEAHLPDDLDVGDVVATPVTGAYGYSMASNYQSVLRPAVVFVGDGRARVVLRRETIDDLVRRDLDLG